jgi:hypothetical protein
VVKLTKKDLIKFGNQCAGFGCDRDDSCETCKDCFIKSPKLHKACCTYEKEVNEYERMNVID